MADLQSAIDALPKMLMADVVFNVNPGNYDGTILLERFTGTGVIKLLAANAIGQATHNTSRMIFRYCNNNEIVVRGFNTTATSAIVVYVDCCAAHTYFKYCNMTAGVKTTVNLFGIYVSRSYVTMVECLISNKFAALRAYVGGKIVTVDLSGTDNYMVYSAYRCGIIHKETGGSISGDMQNFADAGGLIVNQSGVAV
jgi:hypothetical protein